MNLPATLVATALAGLVAAVITSLIAPSLATGATEQHRQPSYDAHGAAVARHGHKPPWRDGAASRQAPLPPDADSSDPDDPSASDDPSATDDPTASDDPSTSADPTPSGTPSGRPSPSTTNRPSTGTAAAPRDTTGASPRHRSSTRAQPHRLATRQPPAGGTGGGVADDVRAPRGTPVPSAQPTPPTRPSPPAAAAASAQAVRSDAGTDGTLTAMSRPLILSGLLGLLIATTGLVLVSWRRRQW
ncbi:MAG TPA: hypothetical protein VF054_18425 [Micromonosporaceae bacterium]